MIGKAKSNKSLTATIGYNERSASELFLAQNMVTGDLMDLKTQMEDLQKCYTGKGKNLTIHAQLSPVIEEGKKLTQKEWQSVAQKFIKKMGMEKLQAIGFIHRDKEHTHCHLVINRVGENDFKLYDDSFIMLKAIKAADEVAEELHLTRAKIVQKEKLANKQSIGKGARQQCKADLEKILSQNPKSLEAYFKAIKSAGFELRLHKNKETGELRGYGIAMNGTYLDASTIDRKLTLKNIEQFIQQGSSLNVEIKEKQAKTPPEINIAASNKSEPSIIKDLVQEIVKTITSPEETESQDLNQMCQQMPTNTELHKKRKKKKSQKYKM
jgi:hypothetical protein